MAEKILFQVPKQLCEQWTCTLHISRPSSVIIWLY